MAKKHIIEHCGECKSILYTITGKHQCTKVYKVGGNGNKELKEERQPDGMYLVVIPDWCPLEDDTTGGGD